MLAPVLLEDGSSLDWPQALYTPTVRIGDGFARVTHCLDGAPLLHKLLDRGDAVWAVELRCPKTLLARTETSAQAEHTLRWDTADVDGMAWLLPGLLAPAPLRLPDDRALNEVWRGEVPEFPAGWWIARGDARRITPLADSLLRFQLDEQLSVGRIAVEPDRSRGNLRFIVRSAPDVHQRATQGDRSLWIAALIGACGLFGRELGRGGRRRWHRNERCGRGAALSPGGGWSARLGRHRAI